MSLPPGFLDELRNRLSLGQVVGRKVTWDNRKSNQGKGDLWAPCPFHQEKSASFHVDDKKGFYYCFGCHAKGDAISFVRETENVGFMEAVQILAGEAGMEMPERDPRAQEKADERASLADVMEQAVRWFRMQLNSGAAADARAYLKTRGLSVEAQERWEIGFVPDAWQGLYDHLTGKGFAPDMLIDAGLAKPSDKGRQPYDTFRNRIIFPIRDARGRAIAFGGRAMDPNDRAKYLNSPETILFDKGRSLYNHGPARAAAGKGHELIVAEGYMDVIALAEAGFEAAVAPLGTAITEAQLDMLWRISPEPVIMLDGDKAGQRAADRLMDLALPKLEGGRSLYFLTLPEGMDPDDYLKAHGAATLRALIDEKKQPLVNHLWEAELNRRPADTPEQRADLDKRLRTKIGGIPDKDVQRYYAEALKNYRWEKFRPQNWAPAFKGKRKQGSDASASAKQSMLASSSDETRLLLLRDRIVAAIALKNPQVAVEFRTGLEQFEVADPTAQTVLDSLVTLAESIGAEELREEVQAAVGRSTTDRLFEDPLVALQPCVRKTYPEEVVLHELSYNIALVTANRTAAAEMAEAIEDLEEFPSAAIDNRLLAATRDRDVALRGGTEDRAQYFTGDNGAKLLKDERDAFEALLEQIRFASNVGRPKS